MPSDKLSGTLSTLLDWTTTSVGRVLISLVVPTITFLVMWQGFLFLRQGNAPQGVTVLIAVLWGVGGVGVIFLVTNWLIEQLPGRWCWRLRPYAFVGPALVILGWYLFMPTLRTFYISFFDARSTAFVGLDNYIFAFTDPKMVEAFRNNLLWLTFGTSFSVILGLFIALLADRSKFEALAKSLIFMPMAISFVGAGVIWRFVYFYRPPGIEQVGLLNALVVALGGDPQAWLTLNPWNNFFLVAILVWMQTGYATVILSAAIKSVPEEILEAGRIDGASEMQLLFHVLLPSIRGTIVTVTTSVLIIILKIFDIVFVMTNGNYGTEVIASQQYKQMFRFSHFGRGAALAILLLLAVIPVMWYNLKQLNEQEAFWL